MNSALVQKTLKWEKQTILNLSFIVFEDLLKIDPSQVGLILIYTFQIINLFQRAIRQAADTETMVITHSKFKDF